MAQTFGSYIKEWFNDTNKAERIWLLAKIEFKLRFYENKLGLLWAIMKPISDVMVYYIAFVLIMKIPTENFVPYLFCGIITWGYFVDSASGAIQILQTKRYLYEYTNMDKIEIYLSYLLSNFIGFLFNLSVFFIFAIIIGLPIDWHVIFLLPLFINLIMLAMAFSLILSSLFVVAKDISQIWSIIAHIGFWISPIIYLIDDYKAALTNLEYYNPIAGVIINVKYVLIYGRSPDMPLFGFDFIYAFFLLLIGIYMLKNYGPKASESF